MWRRLILFILSSAGIYQVSEGQAIYGKIMGENQPLLGATVQVVGANIGAVSDFNGFYQIDSLTAGTYTLLARSIGYQPLKKKVEIKNGNSVEINFNLPSSELGLDEVVITGTLQPKFIKNSPVKVEVLTGEFVNNFSPAPATSILESVKLVNGVQEVTACGVCFTSSISINGLPGAYTAVLIDGTPMFGNLASVYGLSGIPSMIIDRFEVIKGPNSTLYGSEAVAGVINVITKDPEDQASLSIDIMETSHLETFANVAGSIKRGKLSGYIGFNYAYINDFDDENGDGFSDNINLDRYILFSKWKLNRPSQRKFTLATKLYYEDRRNGVEQFLENRNYQSLRGSDVIYGESIYTYRAELFGTYEFNTDLNMRLDYSLSSHLQDSYYGTDHYKAEQHIGVLNYVTSTSVQRHLFSGGITLRTQQYDDNTIATEETFGQQTVNAPDNQFIPGIFIQDEWKTGNDLTILSGIRLDHYQAHGLITSPRLNIKYDVGKWSALRVNFGTGFRIVNLFAEDHAFVSGQRQVVILEDLQPERSYNISTNFNHVYTLGNSQGVIDVDAYYTYFTNKIIPDYSETDKIIYQNTDGYAITKGIGFSINHDFIGPLAMNIAFNWQQAQETDEVDGEMLTRDIEFAQYYSGLFTLNYNHKNSGVNVGYTFQLTGPMALPEVYDLDQNGNTLPVARPIISETFSIHNIQIQKRLGDQWSTYAGIQNIFDYRQPIPPLVGYNDPNAPVGFSNNFDTSYAFAPMHGREFYVGLSFMLK